MTTDSATTSEAATRTDDPAQGFRVRLAPTAPSVAIARSAIRRVVRFRTEDDESRYLTAFTEIVVNAIEAHERMPTDDAVEVNVDLGSAPCVSVWNLATDGPHGFMTAEADHTGDMTGERGRGLLMATALVPGIVFEESDTSVSVTLPLGGFGVHE